MPDKKLHSKMMHIHRTVLPGHRAERKKRMIKIRISYQTTQELDYILRLLHPAIKSAKIKQGQQGAYKKAYIEIK